MGGQLQPRQQVRRDEAPGFGAVARPERVNLSVVGPDQNDPSAVGRRGPEVVRPVLGKGVGASARIAEVVEEVRGGPDGDRGRTEDVPQFPVLRIVGAFAAEIADHRGAGGIRRDGEIRIRQVRDGEVDHRSGLVGLHVAIGRCRALQDVPRIPEFGSHVSVRVDRVLLQVAEPHRVARHRLERAFVDEIFIQGPAGLDRRLREGVGRLADDVDGRLELGRELIAVGGEKGIPGEGCVAGIVGGGETVRAGAVAGPGRRGVAAGGHRSGIVSGGAAAVLDQWIVGSAEIGHPVEGLLHVVGHGRAETDHKEPVSGPLGMGGVPGIEQRLGPGHGLPAPLVHVGLGLGAVAAAPVGIHPVRDQDDELLAAGGGRIGSPVDVEIEFRLVECRG